MKTPGLVMAAGVLLAVSAATIPAQEFPARPIRYVVPFTPGGSQDIIARLVGQQLSERLGQQVVIDNRSGASGLIAADIVAKAPADGHTIFMATAGPVTIAPHLHSKMSYNGAKDFAAVTHLVDTPMALVAATGFSAKSVNDVIAMARAKPGAMNYGSVGNGSISHLTMELFKQKTGIDLVHVPYKGAAPLFQELIGGQVSLLFITTASARSYVNAGRARILAVAARKRTASFPALPTLTEAGIPGLEVPVWAGILTGAQVPKARIDRLSRESVAVLADAAVRKRLAQLGSDVVAEGPDEFGRLLKADYERWGTVVRTAKIRLN